MRTILLTTLGVAMSASVALAADDIYVDNASVDALAVGEAGAIGNIDTYGATGTIAVAGKALAGSVYVDACGCYDDVVVDNDSTGAIAVGNAAAGSVLIMGK